MDKLAAQKASIPSNHSHKLSKKQLEPEDISSTFCMLPWIHLSTRPNGHMRLCCTSNASSAGLIDTHLVYHPAHLNVKVLPKEFKSKIVEKFESFYPWLENYFKTEEFTNHPYGIQRLKGLCRFMQSEDWSVRMPEFKEYIKKMDQIRNTDFSSVFPEMKELLQ